MPFEHGTVSDLVEPSLSEMPLPFAPGCDDCVFEAWERMTYGGVNGKGAMSWFDWLRWIGPQFKSAAYYAWSRRAIS